MPRESGRVGGAGGEASSIRPGKFLNAELDKASEGNERNGIVIDSPNGPVGVVQIAGLVARRIVCVRPRRASDLSPGERIGLIRFGSRLDVYLPLGRQCPRRRGTDRDRRRDRHRPLRRGAAERRVRID